jgi:antitoxin PrlF
MIKSKLTGRCRTTVPQPVRAALSLREGDQIAYAIESGRVVMTNAAAPRAKGSFATFSEWASEADQRAYGSLYGRDR